MIPALVLVALVLAAALAPRFGRPGAVGLAVVSVLWLLLNRPMEGEVLVEVTSSHGLVGADLAGLTGLALAAWGWRRTPRR